jgi:hypothetical protein
MIARALRRLLLTFAIVVCFFATLQFYSERLPIMSSTTEREFNTLNTGLSIALGLSIAIGFSGVISHLRWWILSRDYYSARKVRRHCERLSLEFAKCLRTDRSYYPGRLSASCHRASYKNTSAIFPGCCIAVACFNSSKQNIVNLTVYHAKANCLQLCQIALAAIGLFYSVNRVENYALVITPGNVTIPNMSSIQTVKTVQSNSTTFPAQEFTANR